jgi:hypothetical protein
VRNERYLIVVAALCDGHCAIFDTDTLDLTAFDGCEMPGAETAE